MKIVTFTNNNGDPVSINTDNISKVEKNYRWENRTDIYFIGGGKTVTVKHTMGHVIGALLKV